MKQYAVTSTNYNTITIAVNQSALANHARLRFNRGVLESCVKKEKNVMLIKNYMNRFVRILFLLICVTIAQYIATGCGGGQSTTGNKENCHSFHELYDFLCEYSSDYKGVTFSKTFGTSGYEFQGFVQITDDNGYLYVGNSLNQGVKDLWVIRLDSSGEQIWKKVLNVDSAVSELQKTSDNGYVIGGLNNNGTSYDDPADFWLLKIDENGSEQWEKTYESSGYQYMQSVQQAGDGGYVMAGESAPPSGSNSNSKIDILIIKTDANGNLQWRKTFNKNSDSLATSIKKTTDGGFIINGATKNDVYLKYDIWIIKIDAQGEEEWSFQYGERNITEMPAEIVQTTGGSFIASASIGDIDDSKYLLIKLSEDGNLIWEKTYTRSDTDILTFMNSTRDNGFILAGFTNYNSENNTADLWLVKTDSSGNVQWERIYGGEQLDIPLSVFQTRDAGYIVSGETKSYGSGDNDLWLLKLDKDGQCGDCVFQ